MNTKNFILSVMVIVGLGFSQGATAAGTPAEIAISQDILTELDALGKNKSRDATQEARLQVLITASAKWENATYNNTSFSRDPNTGIITVGTTTAMPISSTTLVLNNSAKIISYTGVAGNGHMYTLIAPASANAAAVVDGTVSWVNNSAGGSTATVTKSNGEKTTYSFKEAYVPGKTGLNEKGQLVTTNGSTEVASDPTSTIKPWGTNGTVTSTSEKSPSLCPSVGNCMGDKTTEIYKNADGITIAGSKVTTKILDPTTLQPIGERVENTNGKVISTTETLTDPDTKKVTINSTFKDPVNGIASSKTTVDGVTNESKTENGFVTNTKTENGVTLITQGKSDGTLSGNLPTSNITSSTVVKDNVSRTFAGAVAVNEKGEIISATPNTALPPITSVTKNGTTTSTQYSVGDTNTKLAKGKVAITHEGSDKVKIRTAKDLNNLEGGTKFKVGDGKDTRTVNKAIKATNAVADIKSDTSGAWCGSYNTANCAMTEGIIAGQKIVKTMAEQTAQRAVQSQGAQGVATTSAQGAALTNTQKVEEEKKVLSQAQKQANTMGGISTVMGALTGWRMIAHATAGKKLNATATNASNEVTAALNTAQADLTRCKNDLSSGPIPNCSAEEARVNEQVTYQKNIKTNRAGEAAAQKGMMMKALQETTTALGEAGKSFMAAKGYKNVSKTLTDLNEQNTPKGKFSLPNQIAENGGDIENAPPPLLGEIDSVKQDHPEDGDDLGGSDPFNPDALDPTGPLGPVAGGFSDSAAAPVGAGGGGGPGSAGGTSAAKEDAAMKAAAEKGQAGGAYAGGDNAPSKRGGAGGAGGAVGSDPNFLDLLKSLLPNAEKEKPLAEVEDPVDRMPASDAAAVLGRGVDIFAIIHKRYVKKSTVDNAVGL